MVGLHEASCVDRMTSRGYVHILLIYTSVKVLFFCVVCYREDVHPRQADAIGDPELNLMCAGTTP